MFSKIVLCVDDSPVADQVASVGADLAQRYHAEVVVLSVLDPARFGTPPYSGLEASQMIDQHSRCLRNTGQRIRASYENLGIRNRLLLLPGRTAQTVVEVAEQEEADLIVMGGEAKGWLRAAMEGSLWTDVARMAPCNVLRVSPKDEEVAEPPRQDRGKRIPVTGWLRPAVNPIAS